MVSGSPLFWKLSMLSIAAVLLGTLLAHGVTRATAEVGDQALVKEAGAACQIASELEQARVVWSSPAYEQHAALIVTGKWPSTRKGGQSAYMLCLFDKHTAEVQLQEIEAALFR